jgi:hypothetical protein
MPPCARANLRRALLLLLLAFAGVPAGRSAAEISSARGGPTYYAPAIEALADAVAQDYVFPEQGREYAQMLRARVASGAYAGITDPAAISERLTQDLRSLHRDLHFRVRPIADAPSGPGSRSPSGAAPSPSPIEGAAWLADGVAYVRFNSFPGTPETVSATRKFMQDHAGARAIIIDARTNHGGGGAEMNVLLPYLYAAPARVLEMEVSREMAKKMGFTADRFFHAAPAPPGKVRFVQVVEPQSIERRLMKAKVYYLTSRETGSAGEALALIFKTTHRATLVGERTRGMDHFGLFVPVGQGLECFMPAGRSFDPRTGKDWEGAGVAPDVVVPPAAALQTALQLARP